MNNTLKNWLIKQHNLDGPDCIRVDDNYGDYPSRENPAVLLTGIMPNTNERGEYFAGYLRELESACKWDYADDLSAEYGDE